MSEINNSENYDIVERVESGEYFADARKWYDSKYLLPYVDRSVYISFLVLVLAILGALLLMITDKLPLVTQIKYSVNVSTADNNRADIHHLVAAEPTLHQIAHIILENYVIKRESYDYEKLNEQMRFIRSTSNNAAFQKFYQYIDLKNPQSPLLRYQKYGRREIEIDSIKILKKNKAVVSFSSKATNFDGKQFEDLKWQAFVGYTQAPIDVKKKNNEDYEFIITSYKLKLLK